MKNQIFLGLFAALGLLALETAEACTGILLKAEDGTTVHGRTLEFGVPVDPSVAIVPRNYNFVGTTPVGDGMKYSSKYAAVGTYCFTNVALMDGVNEAGLSVGTFYFPGYASYPPVTSENQSKALSPVDFPNWILTQFATIDEVKAGLQNVVIAPTVIKEWGNTPPPFHYLVIDKSGNAITIEPLNSRLIVYDNPFGVLTNSPNFDWHLANLRNYINLSPMNAKPLTVEGVTLNPFGQGSGMVGLPGDMTPPSRFVRAAIYSTTAIPSKTGEEAIYQTFHILNQFDIPVGMARQVEGGKLFSDYTLATVARDPSKGRYYFRTYEDQTIRVVDLKSFDLNAREVVSTPATGRQKYVDVSKELKPLNRA